MPRIIYTAAFVDDFDRVFSFLHEKNPLAARKLAGLLSEKLELLASIPQAFTFLGEYRVYFLEFGSSGYAILYDYDQDADSLLLLRIRHQKEAGFL